MNHTYNSGDSSSWSSTITPPDTHSYYYNYGPEDTPGFDSSSDYGPGNSDNFDYGNDLSYYSYQDGKDNFIPSYVTHEDNIPHHSRSSDAPALETGSIQSDTNHVCLTAGCDKSFKRKADLERHYEQKHMPHSEKFHFACDYTKCARALEPFRRADHYRDYHKEICLGRRVRPRVGTRDDRTTVRYLVGGVALSASSVGTLLRMAGSAHLAA